MIEGSINQSVAAGSVRCGAGGLGALLLAFLMVILPACGKGAGSASRTGPVRVVVSIAPLKGLAAELTKELGKNASIDLLVPVGAMEHGYEIPPSMISKLVQADVVVYVGLGLEPQVEKVLKQRAMEGRREVCFADVVGIKADGHDHHHDHAHNHDHGHDHDHGGTDPHLWLDPSLVAKLVPALTSAITDVARERGLTDSVAKVEASAAALKSRVADVDAMYEERLRLLRGRSFITAHAAWGRLAERYGLEQAPLAGLEAAEPSPASVAKAAELIREKKAGAVFSEPQISTAAVSRLAEMTGTKVHQLDPLGDGDWFKMMSANLDALVTGLSPK